MTHRAGVALLAGLLLLTAGCATARPVAGAPTKGTASPGPSAVGTGAVSRAEPRCTTATQPARSLSAGATAMTKVSPPGVVAGSVGDSPFGVAVTAGGQWAFASVGSALAVLRLSAGRPADPVYWINLPELAAGVALTPDGRYLLLAAGAGAVVVSVAAAEHGSPQAVLGELAAPGGASVASAIEVAVTPDGRYAFVSLEYAYQIAVFDLAQAIASGFSANSYVGAVPMQVADVGLAVSPNGRWLYGTSEGEGAGTDVGTLSVISVPKAESDPGVSVLGRVMAGCEPVRVVTSADGGVVWVTARASDALLAFSSGRLRTDPAHALLADVRVGEAPVGLALANRGSLMVVADSNRFGTPGKSASLAVVDVPDALADRPALLGYLPAGKFPRDAVGSPDGSAVLVANYDSGQIETVNVAALP